MTTTVRDTGFLGLYARRPDLLTRALELELDRLVREYGRPEKGVDPATVRAELARIATERSAR